MNSIVLERVSYRYPGPVDAVVDTSVSLHPGELLFAIGPNGAGKSTLLLLAAGLLRPAAGAILVDGTPLTELAPRERARRVAFVPQALDTVPEVRVLDFVLGGRYAHLGALRQAGAEDLRVAREVLERVDALELEQRLLSEVSGGQRQRVLIARALAQETPYLFVDEPTGALDPGHQVSLLKLLDDLRLDGKGVFGVTHDLGLASQFATRLVVLDEGRLVADGSVSEVLSPEVLTPVYGDVLHFGVLPGGAPFVVPVRS